MSIDCFIQEIHVIKPVVSVSGVYKLAALKPEEALVKQKSFLNIPNFAVSSANENV